jgi:RNA polymerase sigma-70 factor, ECF subfamily
MYGNPDAFPDVTFPSSPNQAPGDGGLLSEYFTRHRDRLYRLVQLRFDPRLRGRIDPSDVLQESYLEAATRFGEYQQNPTMPVFLWLRFLTTQKLLQLHRVHLGVQARDAGREQPLTRSGQPEASSAAMAAHLVGQGTSPSQAAVRAEMRVRVEQALSGMEALDREVLVLRHFEQLTNSETAQILGLQESAASKRYVRALKRLKETLTKVSGSV